MKSTKIRIFIDFSVFIGSASGNIKIDKNTYFCRFQRSPVQKRNCSYKHLNFHKHTRALCEMVTFGRRPGQHPQTPSLRSGCRIRWGVGAFSALLGLQTHSGNFTEARARIQQRSCANVRLDGVKVCAQRMHITCKPRAYHVHTACTPRAYPMHTTYIPHAHHVHTTCIPRGNHVYTTCISRTYHVHATCIPRAHRVHTASTPRACHVRTAFIPHAYHVHTDVLAPYIYGTYTRHTHRIPHVHHMHTAPADIHK